MNDNRDRKVHITTFGCQMNEYDSARIIDLLTDMGYQQAAGQGQADLIIFNTCSVRAKAQDKLYSFLGPFRDYKRTHPKTRIVVAGCVAQQEGRRMLKMLPQVDLVLGPDALPDLPRIIPLVERGQRLVYTSLQGQKEMPLSGRSPGLKAQVTVMRGCDNFCSYCVVPYVRGREVSRPLQAIVSEVSALVENGAREVRLLGQNVNSYAGEHGEDFARLLRAVAKVPLLKRIRFTTSHPKDLSPSLIEVMATEAKVMKEIHLPAQSGSNRVLEAMNRGYTRERYLGLVERLREAVPGISVGGDIIVGFPGESEDDFQRTMRLLEEVSYDFLFSFQYSDRPPAPACDLPAKVSEPEKRRRLLVLQARQKEIGLKRNQNLVGRVVEVLVEGPAKKGEGFLSGRDQSGRAINFPGPANLQGSLLQVKLIQANINSLCGQLVEKSPLRSITERVDYASHESARADH